MNRLHFLARDALLSSGGSTNLPSALALLLRPLARLLLRQGITAHEFTAVANAAFVDAAEDVLKEQGKEPNFSRISSLTGLHRHAVSDVVNNRSAATGEGLTQKHYQRNRLARVLAGWFETPDFTDRDGRPRLLPFDGPHPSFTSLVKKFSGDIYPRIILDELVRVKAARMTRDGMVRAVSRRFSSGGADPDALQHLGEAIRDLATTLEHNISAGPDDRLFEDAVVATNLSPEIVPMLRQLIARRGAAFLDDLEGWLAQHEGGNRQAARRRKTVRAGVALYMFADPPPADPAIGGPRQDESR